MFHSRDAIYRNPLGAVPQGKPVHFKITVPRQYACSAAFLIVEKERGPACVLDLFWCGMNGKDKEWWECDFLPDAPGLYFYHFELKTNHGRFLLHKGPGGHAVHHGTTNWQLTVYSADFQTPDWLAGGILYQIFPDRFYNSGTPKSGVPQNRRIHQSWEESPNWQPNENGTILNDDFFGGDLTGIAEKLPYLKELGVTCIYCNPVFRAFSNHRYDTGDYSQIDPLLGNREDFISLCKAAKALGIHLILDGVFSHTGSDSVYFNKYGNYDSPGAYNTQDSPYYSWYHFDQWPENYDCWWGFKTLPNVKETTPAYNAYINGEGGIVRRWISDGAAGWRLDVADELPDAFLDNLYAAAKAEDPQALVLGEVWEDATTKTAYGQRRRYLLGGQMDTVMNYPFREAILSFLNGGDSSYFFEVVEEILENYPPACVRLLMNHIGTHDTERALTLLAGEPAGDRGRQWQSAQKLSQKQYETGIKKLKLAALIQYTLPGVPCVYYGDEAGLQGYRDPFNRGTYPWGTADPSLLDWYRTLGQLRHSQPVLSEGWFERMPSQGDVLGYLRTPQEGPTQKNLLVLLNRGDKIQQLTAGLIPGSAVPVLGTDPRTRNMELEPYGCAVFTCESAPEDLQETAEASERRRSQEADEFIKILDI